MDLKKTRRELHRLAETGEYLPKTRKYIENALCGYNCELSFPWESAVCAFFDAGKNETVAFRADMDALPIQEQGDCGFISENSGTMHACGHDGHMAMLLGIAELMASGKIKPKYNLLALFQPAEETIGGAKHIVEAGVFERYRVKCVFGIHLIPDLPKGQLFTKSGALMSGSCETTVEFKGKSVHITEYQNGIDALEAGTFFIQSLYSEAGLHGGNRRLVRFGKMTSGTVRNAVSEYTKIYGSMRSFSDEDFITQKDAVKSAARRTDERFGTTSSVNFSEGYPPVINDAELVARLNEMLSPHILEKPRLIADDFSWYQRKIPGVYMFLGTGTGIPLHSSNFNFDEQLLEVGVEAYKKIIEQL